MQDQRLEWLRDKMDRLFQIQERLESRGKDFNSSIQGGREYRNPRICEKLIEAFNIKEYGTNLPKEVYDPYGWKKTPDSFYQSSMYRRLHDRREREKQAAESSPPSSHRRKESSSSSSHSKSDNHHHHHRHRHHNSRY